MVKTAYDGSGSVLCIGWSLGEVGVEIPSACEDCDKDASIATSCSVGIVASLGGGGQSFLWKVGGLKLT